MLRIRGLRPALAIFALAWIMSPASATEGRSLAGKLVVASEGMADPRFAQTVIFICRHDSDGAFGLVLNQPLGEMKLAQALKSFHVDTAQNAKGTIEVRHGGPVEGDHGYVLHSDEFTAHGAVCREHGAAVSASLDVLKALGAGKGPKRAILFLGYAGWGPGQLDAEVERKDWVVVPADAKSVFDPDLDGMWKRDMNRRGVDL